MNFKSGGKMKQPTWHPPSKIPFILQLSLDMLDSSREQLVNMEAIQGKPYLLSDREIKRCLKLYTEMNEDVWVFLEQCERWLKQNLSAEEKKQVLEIRTVTVERSSLNQKILALVEKYKHHTINKIMEMDPAELALDVLSGKIDSPLKGDNEPV